MSTDIERHISAINELFKSGRLYIAPSEPQKPKPVYDHWLDAFTYLLLSQPGTKREHAVKVEAMEVEVQITDSHQFLELLERAQKTIERLTASGDAMAEHIRRTQPIIEAVRSWQECDCYDYDCSHYYALAELELPPKDETDEPTPSQRSTP